MASETAVTAAVSALATNYGGKLTQARVALWTEKLQDVGDRVIAGAVDRILEDVERVRIPTVAQFREAVDSVAADYTDREFSRLQCTKCGGLGMFLRERPQAMVVCECPIGARKRLFLNAERSRGRAANTHGTVPF